MSKNFSSETDKNRKWLWWDKRSTSRLRSFRTSKIETLDDQKWMKRMRGNHCIIIVMSMGYTSIRMKNEQRTTWRWTFLNDYSNTFFFSYFIFILRSLWFLFHKKKLLLLVVVLLLSSLLPQHPFISSSSSSLVVGIFTVFFFAIISFFILRFSSFRFKVFFFRFREVLQSRTFADDRRNFKFNFWVDLIRWEQVNCSMHRKVEEIWLFWSSNDDSMQSPPINSLRFSFAFINVNNILHINLKLLAIASTSS